MRKYYKPPMLAATFSPEGKALKTRLEHIFSKQKKQGYFLPVLVLLVLMLGGLVACVPKESVANAGAELPEDPAPNVSVAPPSVPEPVAVGTEPVRDYDYPVAAYAPPLPQGDYTLTQGYGSRKHPVTGEEIVHHGVDLQAAEGTEVYAVTGSTVEQAGYDEVYGNHVVLRHEDGNSSIYGHLSVIGVSAGDRVRQGQTLGAVGATGMATGPHLHLEVRDKYDATIDPTEIIK